MRRLGLGLLIVAAGCGSRIDAKDPGTVYVVVNSQTNGTTGTNLGTTSTNGMTPTPNNTPDPVNNMTTSPPDPTNNMTTDPPDPTNNMNPGQACNNGSDLSAVSASDMPVATRDCTIECLQVADSRGCTAECVSEMTGVSEGCSFCVADFAACGLDFCFNECVEDPNSAGCVSCMQSNCDSEFIVCAGIPAR